MTPLALSEWRDFYVMIGTASGALVGATFIVVTLTAGVPNRMLGIRGFISPTAVHLASVLVGSAILAIPNISALAVTLLLGVGGLMGTVYGAIVVARIWRLKLDLADRCCYGLLPIAAYAAMLAAAAMIVLRVDSPLYVLAASLLLLLIVGMRNAWDMASFMILRNTNPPDAPVA
jgi:hypothetical protein